MDGGRTVLIIDDDADFTRSVRSLLEDEGYVVVEADSGRDGLEKLVRHRPDAIILDVMMDTETDGYGVNEAVKFEEKYREFRDTPIIMVSAIQQSPDERFPRAPEVGMIRPDRYLTKPLDISRFLEVLRRVVRPAHA